MKLNLQDYTESGKLCGDGTKIAGDENIKTLIKTLFICVLIF